MKAATANHTPTLWRDMQRDWEAWSAWEQRIVTAVGCVSSAFALVWFAATVI